MIDLDNNEQMRYEFKATIPIVEFIERKDDDGNKLLVTGIASDTDVDRTGDRMSINAIQSMASQAEGKDLLPSHASEWNEVFGKITESKVEKDSKFRIRGEIDRDNEKGAELETRLRKKQAIGLSIAGWIVSAFIEEEEEDGKFRFTRVIDDLELDHIAFTRVPANPRTFVSQVSKNVDWDKIGTKKDKDRSTFTSGYFRSDNDTQEMRFIPNIIFSEDKVDKLLDTNEEMLEYMKWFKENMDKAVVPFKSYPLADKSKPWNGPQTVKRLKAWAGGPDKDTIDWKKYSTCFTWWDTDNKTSFGSYKLPHHDVPGGNKVTVLRGVRAAMGALLGARGGVKVPEADRKGIFNHLAKHIREFDEEPPEFKDDLESMLDDWFEFWLDIKSLDMNEFLENFRLRNKDDDQLNKIDTKIFILDCMLDHLDNEDYIED